MHRMIHVVAIIFVLALLARAEWLGDDGKAADRAM